MADVSSNRKNPFTFVWKIENFSMCALRENEYLRSPTFTADTLDNTQWFMDLYPKGSQSADDGYMSCFLQRAIDIQKAEIQLDFKFELIGSNGKPLLSVSSSKPREFKQGGQWGWCNFKRYSFLLDNKKQCLPNDVLSIRCFMEESVTTRIPNNFCVARSEVSVDRFSFKWSIEQFSSLRSDCSKIFSASNCLIKVEFGFDDNDVRITISRNSGGNAPPSFVKAKITLLDTNGFQCESQQSEYHFDRDETWEFPHFLKKNKLLIDRKILKDDTLTLRCEFSISDGAVCSEVEEYKHDGDPTPLLNPASFENLKMDLNNMYTNRFQSDIKLRSGDEMYQCHKCILSARSPVFCAMFSYDMEENHSGVVDIPDLDSDTLKAMLAFMYTGCLEKKDYESISKLMVAADKYQISSLKEECAVFLGLNLSENNVCDVLLLADLVQHNVLKTAAVKYINIQWKTILSSEHWKRFIERNIKVATDALCMLSIDGHD